MEKVNLVGVCKLGYREREHLATIRAFGGVILLNTLYWADELRSAEELKAKMVDVSEKEMEMAITLIRTLETPDLDLSQFEDEYREALLERIQAKLNGEPIITAEAPKEEPKMDLVDALMASINAQKEKADTNGTLTERIEEMEKSEVA